MSKNKNDNTKKSSKKNVSSATDPREQQRGQIEEQKTRAPHENDYDVDENDFEQRGDEYKDYENRSRQ